MKNRIQLIKKLLSFGLRNEGFRWVGIKMEILNFRLFSLQLFLAKTKDTDISKPPSHCSHIVTLVLSCQFYVCTCVLCTQPSALLSYV